MNKILIALLGFVLVGGLSQAVAQEKEKEKDGDRKERPQRGEGREGRRGGPGGFNREEFIKKYDKDGDGKLSDEERTAARAERQKEMIKKYDKDGDGKLSQEERQAAREEFRQGRGGNGGEDRPRRGDRERKKQD